MLKDREKYPISHDLECWWEDPVAERIKKEECLEDTGQN